LTDQLGDAQRAMANAQRPSSGSDADNGDALDAMERLRSRLAALDPNIRGDGNAAQRGTQGGSGADARQPGSAGGGADGRSVMDGGIDGQRVGGVYGGGRGNRGGPINGGWNTGNNVELPHSVAPDTTATPADREQVIRQGLQDLDQLRRSVGEDPAARHEIDELVRSMKNLDPKRFPGNPAMVDELYARVLSSVDKLELQLRHEPSDGAAAEVRSDSPQPIPSGYQSAVADYFRRLSQNP
jgi:hypothetical protein